MIALRNAAPVNGGFGPERVDRVPSATMAASSAATMAAAAANTAATAARDGERGQ